MKPSPFSYHRADSVEHALTLLAELEDAKVLAGGQSLMPMMNFRYVAPEHIVDINRVTALEGIQINGDKVTIGAMTRQRDLARHDELGARCPIFKEALHWVGHIATRNRGTIGGSLSHLDPAAELPAVLAAVDAELLVRNAEGERLVSIHDWSLGFMTPDLEADELLCEIRFTLPPANHGASFHEFARRHGDFAMAGAAAVIAPDDNGLVSHCAIAIAGVDVAPTRLGTAEAALTGQKPTPEAVAAAAEHAREVPGLDDVHASAAYRQKLAVVMVRRALTDALVNASGGR